MSSRNSDARIPDAIAAPLADPKAYADARIHETYTWLRANNPLGWAEIEGFDPFWVVTRHADILEVSRQNDLFHNSGRQEVLTDQVTDRHIRQITGGSPHLVRSLVQMDAPDHPKYRALTQSWFMAASLRRIETRIRAIARAAVDKMAAAGDACDFVAEVALHYPLHVVMEILGVPEEDEPRMLRLTQEIFGPADPDNRRAVADDQQAAVVAEGLRAVLADFYAYFGALSADRRANPREDLATVIATSQIDGKPIPEFEALSYYVIVATAGHDTTSSSTATALWALCENPAEFAKVKADPALIPGLIDEALRWGTPVKHFMRTATADTELRGRRIAEGDWLMLCYASANRDEEVFDDPFAFRAARRPNKHLAFGYGGHVCLGQHLAKLEMRILFEELLARLHSVELAGAPVLSHAVFVNGPKTLPIRFRMD